MSLIFVDVKLYAGGQASLNRRLTNKLASKYFDLIKFSSFRYLAWDSRWKHGTSRRPSR